MRSHLFNVSSSEGNLEVLTQNGQIRSKNVEPDSYLNRIIRFDVKEYQEYYGVPQVPRCVDILDIGYWYTPDEGSERKYEPAEPDWREEVKLLRQQNK